MNTCYKHFYYFVMEFGLVDKKELEPLVGTKVQIRHVRDIWLLVTVSLILEQCAKCISGTSTQFPGHKLL